MRKELFCLLILIILFGGCIKVNVSEEKEELCGNNVVDKGETCTSCPEDAGCPKGEKCMNGKCEALALLDLCGNGVIDEGETSKNCCTDVGCLSESHECISNRCQLKKCSDDTPYTYCSEEKPFYCEKGELIEKCSECGCPDGLACKEEKCVEKIVESISGNKAPVVDAGLNSEAELGSKVFLKGTGTDDSSNLSYSWKQIHGPTTEIMDAGTALAWFYPSSIGEYVFELTLSDTELESKDSVKINVVAPKNYAFLTLGNNELVFFDESKEFHSTPLILELNLSGKAVEDFFEFDGKTIYYSQSVSEFQPITKTIDLRENGIEGTLLGKVKYGTEIAPIVLNDSKNLLNKYALFVNESLKKAWIFLKESEFRLPFNRSLFFRGIDVGDKGDLFPKDSYKYLIPDNSNFSEYRGGRGEGYFNIGYFNLVNNKTGKITLKIFIDSETQDLLVPTKDLKSYNFPVIYYKAGLTSAGVKEGAVSTGYKEELKIEEGKIIIKASEPE